MVSFKFNPFTGTLDMVSEEDLSGYVPYTGATTNVDLGEYDLTATNLSGVLTDGVTATTQAVGDNSTKVATTAYVETEAEAREHYDKYIDVNGSGDYTSIATAVSTEAANTTFFIRGGTYTMTENIVLKTGQQLIGESKETVIIDQNLTTYKILVQAAPNVVLKNFSLINGRNLSEQLDVRSSSHNCIIEEIYMASNRTETLPSYVSGLMIEYSDDCFLNNVTIEGYLYNFKIEYSNRTRMSNLYSNDSQLYGFRFRGSNYSTMNNIVSYYDGSAVYFRDSSYAVITNMAVEGAIYGFYCYAPSTHNTITNFQGTCYTSFAYFRGTGHDYNTFIGVDLPVDFTINSNYTKMIGCTISNLTIDAGATNSTITGCKFGTLTDNGTNTNISGSDYTSNLNQIAQNTDMGIGVNDPDSRFEVKGSGATSATYATTIRNSSDTALLRVRDDGLVTVGDDLTVGGDLTVTGSGDFTDEVTIGGTDSLVLDHDETDAVFTTDDGAFKFSSVEGHTDTTLIIRAQREEEANLNMMLEDTDLNVINLNATSLKIEGLGTKPVRFFENSPESTIQKLSIYGFGTHDSLRHMDIGIDPADAKQMLFDNMGSYKFDGILLGTTLNVSENGSFGTGLIVNETGNSAGDFRWESDSLSTAVVFDATGYGDLSFNASTVFNESGYSFADVRMETDTEANAFFLDAGEEELNINVPLNVNGVTNIGDGGTTNYSEFEADGTLAFAGDATVWKDINMGAAQLSKPASSQPDTDEFVDEAGADTGIETYAFAPGEKVSGSFEMQHDYKEGSDITFHVHFQGITAPTGTDKVKWQLIYTLARDDATLDAATTITTEVDFDTQYEFIRADFTAITGTNFKIGDQFLFQLSRIAATADEYAGDALIATAGVHYQIDTVGSRQIVTK